MSPNLLTALELLQREGHTCVLCRGEKIYTSDVRGVGPLLRWLDEGIDAAGCSAADKVVGRGAAFLYVLLGVKEVHALVMSEKAREVLVAYGIRAACDSCPPRILNRDQTGFCPIEAAVSDITDAQEALSAIRMRLAQLRG